MNPLQFVPVNVSERIHVYEEDGRIIILNDDGKDVSEFYLVEIRKTKQTEMVIVSPARKKRS